MFKQAIKNCPDCLDTTLEYDGVKRYRCISCGWEYYHNTAAAVAGILEFEGKILAVVRNREPGICKLDFPGGFVDPEESAEQALEREVWEELGVKINAIRYLCSAPNLYAYKKIDYCTCDIFYTAVLETNLFKIEQKEIAGYNWLAPDELSPEKFAFQSAKVAIDWYKALVKS